MSHNTIFPLLRLSLHFVFKTKLNLVIKIKMDNRQINHKESEAQFVKWLLHKKFEVSVAGNVPRFYKLGRCYCELKNKRFAYFQEG